VDIGAQDINVALRDNGKLTNVLQGNHFSNNGFNIMLNAIDTDSTINISNSGVALEDSNTADSDHVTVNCKGLVTIDGQDCITT